MYHIIFFIQNINIFSYLYKMPCYMPFLLPSAKLMGAVAWVLVMPCILLQTYFLFKQGVSAFSPPWISWQTSVGLFFGLKHKWVEQGVVCGLVLKLLFWVYFVNTSFPNTNLSSNARSLFLCMGGKGLQLVYFPDLFNKPHIYDSSHSALPKQSLDKLLQDSFIFIWGENWQIL